MFTILRSLANGSILLVNEFRHIPFVTMSFLLKLSQACRGSRSSRGAIQKVPKQVALASIKRTLGRCKSYEEAGISCFSEPTLQNVMFAANSCEKDTQSADYIVSGTASNTCNKASHQIEARNSGISILCFCLLL